MKKTFILLMLLGLSPLSGFAQESQLPQGLSFSDSVARLGTRSESKEMANLALQIFNRLNESKNEKAASLAKRFKDGMEKVSFIVVENSDMTALRKFEGLKTKTFHNDITVTIASSGKTTIYLNDSAWSDAKEGNKYLVTLFGFFMSANGEDGSQDVFEAATILSKH